MVAFLPIYTFLKLFFLTLKKLGIGTYGEIINRYTQLTLCFLDRLKPKLSPTNILAVCLLATQLCTNRIRYFCNISFSWPFLEKVNLFFYVENWSIVLQFEKVEVEGLASI